MSQAKARTNEARSTPLWVTIRSVAPGHREVAQTGCQPVGDQPRAFAAGRLEIEAPGFEIAHRLAVLRAQVVQRATLEIAPTHLRQPGVAGRVGEAQQGRGLARP